MATLLPTHDWREMPQRDRTRPIARPIVVGLVNNMPDAALRSTERQFCELLAAAVGDRPIALRLFSLPGLARSPAARQHFRDHYEDIEALWGANLDGLIVTGTEPLAAGLADEPYWPALTRLIDWAGEHTIASIWSCLAAHAAVRYLDGIERHPLGGKLSGVYQCVKLADHPLVGGGVAGWCTPHSRHNALREEELTARGYQILGRSPAAGADLFVKQCGSLFLFLQGHPEYDSGALLREYRRDVGRFLAGESHCYPEMPCGYFGEAATAALSSFRERALRGRDVAILAEFPMSVAKQCLSESWQEAAIRLYRNWLSLLDAATSPRFALAPSQTPSRRQVGADADGVPAYG